MKQPSVYIMTNKKDGVLYVGVTSNLVARVFQHKQATTPCFTKKYNCTVLAYYEIFADMPSAIAREKQIKAGSRSKKLKLIENQNPEWKDLYDYICK